MRIERVDEKTVKCFLTNEELDEYEIDYKDFIMRSERAREVVQEIMKQAIEEVGYRPPKFAFDLQIMLVPDQGMVLTFSEKDPEIKDGEQLMECLREMRRMLDSAREAVGRPPALPGSFMADAPERRSEERPGFAVFLFSELREVMEYAAVLPANLRVGSELYELDGQYYLYLTRGHASYERYSRACIQAMEFGELYTALESRVMQLKEQGTCLIGEKALKKLASINGK
ncbi:MAG: adaptor protein MecA [Roseburia sp.]|nr:adaptor protein MecA [Roseburia sp.]MCM1096597.1 adaptor protein MecA [Ruminococcus flavefaciens]